MIKKFFEYVKQLRNLMLYIADRARTWEILGTLL